MQTKLRVLCAMKEEVSSDEDDFFFHLCENLIVLIDQISFVELLLKSHGEFLGR